MEKSANPAQKIAAPEKDAPEKEGAKPAPAQANVGQGVIMNDAANNTQSSPQGQQVAAPVVEAISGNDEIEGDQQWKVSYAPSLSSCVSPLSLVRV